MRCYLTLKSNYLATDTLNCSRKRSNIEAWPFFDEGCHHGIWKGTKAGRKACRKQMDSLRAPGSTSFPTGLWGRGCPHSNHRPYSFWGGNHRTLAVKDSCPFWPPAHRDKETSFLWAPQHQATAPRNDYTQGANSAVSSWPHGPAALGGWPPFCNARPFTVVSWTQPGLLETDIRQLPKMCGGNAGEEQGGCGKRPQGTNLSLSSGCSQSSAWGHWGSAVLLARHRRLG